MHPGFLPISKTFCAIFAQEWRDAKQRIHAEARNRDNWPPFAIMKVRAARSAPPAHFDGRQSHAWRPTAQPPIEPRLPRDIRRP
jgi:hypothetical protein